MNEYQVAAYEKLSAELEIPILAPEIAAGSLYTRAEWVRREASDMSRIDVLRGGVTGCLKTAAMCEAFGVRLEIHMAGFGNLQVLGATSEDTCRYYERGLLAPGVDYETPEPYLAEICDPLDLDGYVRVPGASGHGLPDRLGLHRRAPHRRRRRAVVSGAGAGRRSAGAGHRSAAAARGQGRPAGAGAVAPRRRRPPGRRSDRSRGG